MQLSSLRIGPPRGLRGSEILGGGFRLWMKVYGFSVGGFGGFRFKSQGSGLGFGV